MRPCSTRPNSPGRLGLLLGLGLATVPVAAQTAIEGAEAEAFLRTARVVAREPIGTGITRSERLTLDDGTRTARAAWKTVNQRVMGLTRMENGDREFDFRDSWKHEVAAYELDKLLGLGLVPPTVERRIEGRTGALQLWVEDSLNELERRRRVLRPPDALRFRERRAAARLLRELTHDTDANIQNTLYGPGFRVYTVDFSRGFRIAQSLVAPERLERFPRGAVDRLRALDREACEAHLRPWLDGLQIAGLLRRREQLLALVERRIGEAADQAFVP